MTREELRIELKPKIVDCVSRGEKPGPDIVEIAARWLRECGLPMEEAFNGYNLTVASIMKDCGLRRH